MSGVPHLMRTLAIGRKFLAGFVEGTLDAVEPRKRLSLGKFFLLLKMFLFKNLISFFKFQIVINEIVILV